MWRLYIVVCLFLCLKRHMVWRLHVVVCFVFVFETSHGMASPRYCLFCLFVFMFETPHVASLRFIFISEKF